MPEFVIRPMAMRDLKELYALVQSMKTGLASLPPDELVLKQKILASTKAFQSNITAAENDHYLFGLEEIRTGKIVGVSGIYSRSGGGKSFFAYEIKDESYTHKPFKIKKDVKVLHLKEIRRTPSEMCSLYLQPKFRHSHLGSLLALSRYMYMLEHPKRFSQDVIAVLRGYRDSHGESPFWLAIGKYFFEGTLRTTDSMKSLGNKEFIRDLMPKYPIYIPLLNPKAQEAIGVVHKKTEAAQKILIDQGFSYDNLVDIFDAGPIFSNAFKNIKVVRNAQKAKIKNILPSFSGNADYLIANRSNDFRACVGHVKVNKDNTVDVAETFAECLKVNPGDYLAFSKI